MLRHTIESLNDSLNHNPRDNAQFEHTFNPSRAVLIQLSRSTGRLILGQFLLEGERTRSESPFRFVGIARREWSAQMGRSSGRSLPSSRESCALPPAHHTSLRDHPPTLLWSRGQLSRHNHSWTSLDQLVER
jgi:hypothetical protein